MALRPQHYISIASGGGGLDLGVDLGAGGSAVPVKVCRRCSADKPRDQFNRKKDMRDGLQPNCRDCQRALKRGWYEENTERAIEHARKWESAHPAVALARVERWRAANPDKARVLAVRVRQVRRARLKGAFVESVNPTVVFERDGWVCGICALPIPSGSESLDHVVPLSRGGKHSYENVQAAHLLCNVRKQAKVA